MLCSLPLLVTTSVLCFLTVSSYRSVPAFLMTILGGKPGKTTGNHVRLPSPQHSLDWLKGKSKKIWGFPVIFPFNPMKHRHQQRERRFSVGLWVGRLQEVWHHGGDPLDGGGPGPGGRRAFFGISRPKSGIQREKNVDWTDWTMTGWWFGTEFYTFSWECHHPNWRTHIFQRGRAQPPTRGICGDFTSDGWNPHGDFTKHHPLQPGFSQAMTNKHWGADWLEMGIHICLYSLYNSL